MLIPTNAGSYPRIGDSYEQQKLRRAIAAWEKGQISDEELHRIENEVTQEVIQEQVRAGLKLVTDGQIRWYDPISHLARRLEGTQINGLLRFFDTNFYFRQPVIVGKLSRRGPMIVDEYRFAASVSPVPVKPVLTGPYTLAKLSIWEKEGAYRAFEDLVMDYAKALREEIADLFAAGASVVQVDEPAILRSPEEWGLFSAAVGYLAEGQSGELALYTYFYDATPLYERFQELPVQTLGFDFTYAPQLPDRIAAEGSEKTLGLGLIDGRNTRMERPEEVLAVLERVMPAIRTGKAYLNPSCGLEYLPRARAFEKLVNLVKIAETFEGRAA